MRQACWAARWVSATCKGYDGLVPSPDTPFLEFVKKGIANREQLDLIRQRYDEATELCYGNISKGIIGWRECWDECHRYNEK